MATMHPLLFLGLGGTGGKVLGVVQNTLSRRLRSVGRSEEHTSELQSQY
mgnify:CR=1 FL=1